MTDFGDQAVLLPLGAAIGLYLLASRWRRGGSAWAVSVAAVFGATLVAKLAGFAASELWGTTELRSPSGHVAAGAMIYGSLIAIVLRPAWGTMRAQLAWAAAIATMLGVSRIGVGAHNLPEVLAGGLLGLGGASCFSVLAGAAPARLDRTWLVLMAVSVVAMLHGRHLPIEGLIHGWAADAVLIFQ